MSTLDTIRARLCLEADLHQALRLKSKLSRRTMSDLVNDALRQALREDQEDLAAARARTREKALGFEEFLAKLEADGAP